MTDDLNPEENTLIDFQHFDQTVPLTEVETPRHRHHKGNRMSSEHVHRIRRRHRRDRFLFKLDMILLIIVCLCGAGIILELQALQ